MRINKPLISGMIFFLFALSVISFSGIKFNLFPTQEVDLSNNADFGQVLPGNVFIQEITMKKDYLEQIDLYIGRINNDGINETVMLIVDESGQILFFILTVSNIPTLQSIRQVLQLQQIILTIGHLIKKLV